ncbi:Oligosaccharyltransferase PglB [Thermosulfurimonas dismutans]|uniref:Oligosaccharyltransferase PglB n=2 Tax=Thermosulfurimonas dismutans TaxID=999894 RepID=A0A179D6R3_9BACT|nr:Oligosaccharyltransferase PglB [Thermosulfurimonas dismutans]
MGAGLALRFDDLRVWEKRKNIWYLEENRPIFTSYDAFYFARLARDWQEGRYRAGKRDPYRFVPDNYLTDNITYPFPVPLMSFSAAKLSDWFGVPLEKLALYYTPITAVLFVIPLFLYLESLGYTAAGLLGGLCGVTALIYVIRTSIARFDTDSLNLFFPFAIAWALAMYFRGRRPLLWATIASILLLIFFFWYPVSHLMFVMVCTFIAVLLFEKKGRLEKKDIVALIILLVPNMWYLWKSPLSMFNYLKNLLVNIVSPAQEGFFGDFPNIMQSISELQQSKSINQVAALTLHNRILFIIGLLGMSSFFVRERKYLFFLLPYFLIGLLVFRSGNRFAMYLAPFIGMGLGFLIHFLIEKSSRILNLKVADSLKNLAILLITVILGVLIFWAQKNSRAYVALPKVNAFVARDMKKLGEITPPEAWIWTWWDYGYAFSYFSRRGVFIDGGSQTSPKTYYVALSFASSSPEEAYHIIAYLAREGLTGIKKRLKEDKLSAKELTENIKQGKFYQSLNHPVYWVFTQDLPLKYGWIGYFGTWNFGSRKGHFGFVYDLNPCRRASKTGLLFCKNSVLDLKKGTVRLGSRWFNLSKILVISGKDKVLQKTSFDSRGLILEVVNSRYGQTFYLADERSFRSNFNQMYILKNYDPKFFELVLDDFPFMVVYKVKWTP